MRTGWRGGLLAWVERIVEAICGSSRHLRERRRTFAEEVAAFSPPRAALPRPPPAPPSTAQLTLPVRLRA